jgi:transposase-like protein
MPYKSEHIKLKGLQDRRRKLTEEQKEAIRSEYAMGNVGHRPLAEKYGVSRSLIRIITDEKTANRISKRTKEHWKDYSNVAKHTEAIRNLRRYKQDLYLKGELIEEENHDGFK